MPGTNGELPLAAVTVRGGKAAGDSGGGGIADLGGTVSLVSSDVTGNTVASGGIYTDNGASSFVASPVTGNTATTFGGGGIYKNSGGVTLSEPTPAGQAQQRDLPLAGQTNSFPFRCVPKPDEGGTPVTAAGSAIMAARFEDEPGASVNTTTVTAASID
uniref:hypothetical protein n=1 Tax=Streptomyces sp. NBC_00857 TaxID=2975851 RepID=UPI002F90FEE8|nr:hypothetical protein OH820_35470 [Streptomyces sp. NBC_00857]